MNASYPCGLPPFFHPDLGVPEAVNILQAIIAMLSALVSAPINIYLFIIILKYKELHQRSLLLSLQIIAIEILYHLTVPISILISTINGTWVLGDILCDITGMIHDAFAMLRFTMTLVLTTDRFLSVYQPFFYSKKGGALSWSLSAVAWTTTLVRVVLPLTGILGCYVYIPTFKTCTIYPGCSNQCEILAAWGVTVVVISGVILPLLLYTVIFYIIRKITRYQMAIQASIKNTKDETALVKNNMKKYKNLISNRKRFVTVSILMISIMGTTPAFTLYMASIFYHRANLALFIVNMLIGRTSFNVIPFFDALAFSRHHDVKMISLRIFKSMKLRSSVVSVTDRARSSEEHSHSSEPAKLSLTQVQQFLTQR